jgi:predicted dinucleotide-binding enzyme
MLRHMLLAGVILTASIAQVIGTGNVGMALGTEFGGLGHTVIYGSRTPDAAKTAALVNKTRNASAALPADAAVGDLSGKIIIDVTNPLRFVGSPPTVTYGTDRSNGEIVQEAHPNAFVVKAFNTIGWPLMIDPPIPAPVIPLAGENTAAKKQVAEWVRAMGIDTVDVGGIYHARATEFMVVMMLNNRFTGEDKFELVFRKKQ